MLRSEKEEDLWTATWLEEVRVGILLLRADWVRVAATCSTGDNGQQTPSVQAQGFRNLCIECPYLPVDEVMKDSNNILCTGD
jgi:hypothetical protein